MRHTKTSIDGTLLKQLSCRNLGSLLRLGRRALAPSRIFAPRLLRFMVILLILWNGDLENRLEREVIARKVNTGWQRGNLSDGQNWLSASQNGVSS